MAWRHVRIVYGHCEKTSTDLAHSIKVLRAASTRSISKAFVTLIYATWRSGMSINRTGNAALFSSALIARPYASSGKSSLQILLFLILPLFRKWLGEVS